MHRWIPRVVLPGLLIGVLLTAGCGDAAFPVTPTPTANTPVVTLQGANYQGTIVLDPPGTTTFNMTLIARGLGQTSPQLAEQAPGTVLVNGNFETGNGIVGTIEGTLEGTMANGTFRGTLTVTTGGCTEQREYSGHLTGSGVALVPGNWLQSCPNNVLTFTVQLARPLGSPCTFSIGPTVAAFPSGGGAGSVNIGTAAGCAWAAEALVPWLSITGSATGTGTATLGYNVQANTGIARQGTLRVAGQTLTVNQSQPCTYSIAPSSATVAAAGGVEVVTVTAPNLCAWTAQSQANWITVSPSEGAGNGPVTLTVQPNAGAERQGTVIIAGHAFVVSQPALPCTFSISPQSASFGLEGGTGNVVMTASTARCTWTAQTAAPWIQLTGATSGTGSGNVAYTVQPNQGATRSGTIIVAGRTLTVTQGERGTCVYQISPPGSQFPVGGGPGAVTITAAAHCTWTAGASQAPWIELTSPASGTGPATVTYRVLPNQGPARTGSVSVVGETTTLNHVVTQLGASALIIVAGTPDFSGNGLVASDPAGIKCSIVEGTANEAGCSASFAVGGQVTLTATTTTGFAFVGWSGACLQFGENPTCTLGVVSPDDINVTAAFRGDSSLP